MQQLDLFQLDDELKIERLENRLEEVHQTCDRVRKGIFMRHNDLAKKYIELSERMDRIECMQRNLKQRH